MRTKVVALMLAALIPVSVMTSGAFGSQGQVAQVDPMEQFRKDLISLVQAYEDCPASNMSAKVGLDEQIAGLSDDELELVYGTVPDPRAFSDSVETIQTWCEKPVPAPGSSDARGDRSGPSVAAGDTTPYPPDYPRGNSTDTFRATLPGLGILLNGPDNRTDTNAVAAAWISLEAFKVAEIIAAAACDTAGADPTGIATAIACPVAGAAAELTQATQIVVDQADFQDSNVDAAEIEAGYENTVKLLRRVDRLESELYEVVRLLNTPESRRSSDLPACNGHACLWPER